MELLFFENLIDSCVCFFIEIFRGCKREVWKLEIKSNFMCKFKIRKRFLYGNDMVIYFLNNLIFRKCELLGNLGFLNYFFLV